MYRYPETGENYAAATFQSPSGKAEISVAYDVVLYEIAVDFSKIGEIYPYQKDSLIYKRYTGASGNIVDPLNSEIKTISDRLWARSANTLEYAKNSYLYVAENYRYLNPNTGIRPLKTILQAGGGDCGNLTSIFVSLLRSRGIPARHLVGVRPNGTYHVWADFYLERYCWIPVDVTYKNSNKKGDFFGRVAVADAPVIVSLGVDLTVLGTNNESKKTALMQNFVHWNRYTSPVGKLDHKFKLENLSRK